MCGYVWVKMLTLSSPTPSPQGSLGKEMDKYCWPGLHKAHQLPTKSYTYIHVHSPGFIFMAVVIFIGIKTQKLNQRLWQRRFLKVFSCYVDILSAKINLCIKVIGKFMTQIICTQNICQVKPSYKCRFLNWYIGWQNYSVCSFCHIFIVFIRYIYMLDTSA